jgi:hypothetical protein
MPTSKKRRSAFEKLSDNAYAYTAEGDPNTGVIIGDDGDDHRRHGDAGGMAQDVIRTCARSPTSRSST